MPTTVHQRELRIIVTLPSGGILEMPVFTVGADGPIPPDAQFIIDAFRHLAKERGVAPPRLIERKETEVQS